MGSNKLGSFILGGALLGAAISMLDRSTRRQTVSSVKASFEKAMYYRENPDVVRNQFQEKKEKVQSLYEQVKGDVDYIKTQVDEIKTLTPQVKEMLSDTKEAFTESKTEYQQIIDDEAVTTPDSAQQDATLPPMVQKKNVIPLKNQ